MWMWRLAIATWVLLSCSCSDRTSILLTVGGDMAPGAEVDGLEVDAWRGGALAWSGERSLSTATHMPVGITISAEFPGSDPVDLTVTAKLGGRVVIEVSRQAAVLPGKQVEVPICLWRRCVGSELQQCREGSCEPLPADGDGDADLDSELDGVDGDKDRDDDDLDADRFGYPALSLSGVAVSSETICDLNGDGVPDNAFSRVAPSVRGIMGTFLNDVLTGSCGRVQGRCDLVVIDTSEMEDPATPADASFQCSVLIARDCEFDETDNDVPGQVLRALPDYFDGAGGPPINVHDCSVVEGTLRARGEGISFFTGIARDELRLYSTTLTANVGPRMESAEDGRACGYFEARQLATVPIASLGRSFLDVIVAGGDAVGLPGVPGQQPDLDVDADGLETFRVDASGRVVECLDGDGASLPAESGVPCTQREEVADGFSFVLEFDAVGAELIPPVGARDPCAE